ncbi:MAG: family 78 glycoside hydrolase catalytic domain [Chlorobi bacterium]|nr:family 78 glycoside hydrolase catalytic domain [Chlorobiota bacterium]
MKNFLFLFLTPIFLLSGCSSRKNSVVENLTCEYLTDPVGIDILQPRLSWQLISSVNGQHQTAYQILAATRPELLSKKKANLWNTGKIASDQSILIHYAGKELQPRMQIYWKVRVWDKDGRPGTWSTPAMWEMGIGPDGWNALWIGSPAEIPEKPGKKNPAFCFRKDIEIPATVTKGRVYISGLGYYEIYINGKKIGDHVLSPNHSNYDRRNPEKFKEKRVANMSERIYYETFDITPLLNQGMNTLAVCLGNGWYFQHERDEDTSYTYSTPRFISQFEMELSDGTKELIVSDTSWRTSTGPIIHNGVYTGEIYDARLELPGWSRPGFDDTKWKSAVLKKAPVGKLLGQIAPPDRKIREVHPVSVIRISDSIYRFDLGEMISGWVRLKVSGLRGTNVILKFIEETGPQYNQTDTYILKGKGTEVWEPRFTWHAFRYVEAVTSLHLDTSSLTGVVVNTDVPRTGRFECSNKLLKRINENFVRTQQGNMHGGVPSDCPHRERRGYTGDGQIAAPAAICNFNMAAFYTKWLNDIADAQNKTTGYVPNTAPYQSGGGGTPWGSAYIIIPWYMYLYYGDTTVLQKHYEGMKKWIGYLQSLLVPPGIINEENLGEWVPPEPTAIPPSLVSTAYYYRDLRLMESVAEILGKEKDAVRFGKSAEETKKGFNEKYFHKKERSYSIGRQGTNVFPLGFGLVPDEYIADVFKTLTNHIEKDTDGHFDTGMMGTPLLLQVLSEYGRPELAYSLMNQKDFPGFGYQVAKGSTTIWETWDGNASHSHPMFGSVCRWFYNSLAGINPDPRQPGFRHIIIRPQPVADLYDAGATYASPYGNITSSWEMKENNLVLDVAIPPNTTATVSLPANDDSGLSATETDHHSGSGISYEGVKDHVATYRILPGRYRFVSENIRELIPFSMLTAPIISPPDTVLFSGDSVTIILQTDHKNAMIRYTLDGQDPDSVSPVYRDPLMITKSTRMKARVFSPGRKPGPVRISSYGFVDRKKNGLQYAYYRGLWPRIPDFSRLTPAATGRIYEINLDRIPYGKDQFGLILSGEINIPENGNYTFYLSSNDGSKLYIDNRLVANNDGGHTAVEKRGNIKLTKGRHHLVIQYFQLGGGYYLSLSFSGPGIKKRKVPASMFFFPAHYLRMQRKITTYRKTGD